MLASDLQRPSDIQAERIAREFEDFAYIVSHDLNAPLRHVREFTNLLIGTRRDNLNEEEQEYIMFLERSLDKLDKMQQALLTISRLNTRAGDMLEINCNLIIEQAIKKLDYDTDRETFEFGNLPTLIAEPKQIEMLFYQLVDNALKFQVHHEALQKKIRINAEEAKDGWVFRISDNGIGIDPKYHEEIFRLFKQLEPNIYSGIGAGLTIAHKIVGRHGGRIWVESQRGRGTDVFFVLPKY